MKITYELLKEKGACNDGLRWFKKNFLDGCELNDETIAKVSDCPTDFIWWFYNNVQQDKRLYKLCGVNESNGVNWSFGVNGSDGVNRSDGVNWSDGVDRSYGVNRSDGVNGSFGIFNSFGVDHALFLANKPIEYSIFGKSVSEGRFNEVWFAFHQKLNGWKPTFNNIKALYLKHGSDWALTPVKDATELSIKEAWEGMPKEAVEYVASLPEFDAAMFKEITGIEV